MRDGLRDPRRERVGIRLIGPDEPRRAIHERKKERARPRTLRDDLPHEIRPRDWLDPRKRLRDRRDNVGCEIVRRDLVVGPDLRTNRISRCCLGALFSEDFTVLRGVFGSSFGDQEIARLARCERAGRSVQRDGAVDQIEP